MFYKDKVVWITGASSGIGEALVYELARQNAKIILSSNDSEGLEKVKTNAEHIGGSCHVQYLDMMQLDDIDKVVSDIVQSFGRIDVLINNAGISQRAYTYETPIEVDRKIMEIDFFGTLIVTKAVLQVMMNQKSGYIAATSSISGKFGFPLRSAYASAKHALSGFFETLRAEVYNYNIKVLVAFPGRVQTNISLHALTKEGKAHGQLDDGQKNGITSEKCAKQYLKAIRKDKKEVLIGSTELLMVYIHKYFRRIFYVLARKINPT